MDIRITPLLQSERVYHNNQQRFVFYLFNEGKWLIQFWLQHLKKSNVVKEVEKLKRNRDERRQRQAEEKAEKEAYIQQLAPENPHWELLSMIL